VKKPAARRAFENFEHKLGSGYIDLLVRQAVLIQYFTTLDAPIKRPILSGAISGNQDLNCSYLAEILDVVRTIFAVISAS
jgi:hypothetical protein